MTSRFSIFPASAAKLLPRALMIGALLLVLLLLCQWVQYEFSAVQHIPRFDDFNVYRTAGLKALGHRTAYDVSGHFQFNYPPFAALVYAHTFAAGPLRATETFWYWSTIGLFCLVALWAAFRLLPKHNVILSLDGSVALVLLQVGAYTVALRDETKLGQTTLIPIVICVLALELEWVRDRVQGTKWRVLIDVALGLLLAFGAEIKIYLALVFAVFAVRKRVAVCVTGLLAHFFLYSGAFMVLAHGLEFAVAEHGRWIESASRYANLRAAGDINNVSIASFVWKRMTPLDSKIANLLALACVAGVLVMWRKRSIGESVAFALFSVTLANPVVWPYWLLLGVMYFTWVCGRLLARDLHPATFLFPILYLVAAQFQNHHFVEDGWMTEAAFVFGLGTIVALAIAPTRAATPHITALAGGFNE